MVYSLFAPKSLAVLFVLCWFSCSLAYAQDASLWSKGSFETVQKAVQQGADVHKVPGKGFTPLMNAVGNPDNRVVDLLLKAGADPNAGTANGLNPIRVVAMFGENPEVVHMLAKAGANLEKPDGLGYTPLMTAIDRNANTEIIRALLKAGAKPDARTPEGDTPFMVVAGGLLQRPELVAMLCEAGGDINARNAEGVTALMKAVHSKPNLEMVKAFLAQKADVNISAHSGNNALTKAIAAEEQALVQLLEKAGARLPVKR